MTERDAFKYGFLMQCEQYGLTEEQTRDRLVKTAATIRAHQQMEKQAAPGAGVAGQIVGEGIEGASRLGSAVLGQWPLAALAMVGLPVGVGMGGGYLASQLRGETYDKDLAKTDEEIAEYYRAIDQLRRSRRQRQMA